MDRGEGEGGLGPGRNSHQKPEFQWEFVDPLSDFETGPTWGHRIWHINYWKVAKVLKLDLSPNDSEVFNTFHKICNGLFTFYYSLFKITNQCYFRCLHKTGGCIYMNPKKYCAVIMACARLHNFCLQNQVPLPQDQEIDDNDDDGVDDNVQVNDAQTAVNYRQQIIRLF